MQQTGMNTLYTKVSSVREQLILFAGQMESLEQDYNTVVAELENSFVDSKAFWERTTTDKKATASQKAGIALERLDLKPLLQNVLLLLKLNRCKSSQCFFQERESSSMGDLQS